MRILWKIRRNGADFVLSVKNKKWIVANAIRTNTCFWELSVKNGQFVANAKEGNDKIYEK